VGVDIFLVVASVAILHVEADYVGANIQGAADVCAGRS